MNTDTLIFVLWLAVAFGLGVMCSMQLFGLAWTMGMSFDATRLLAGAIIAIPLLIRLGLWIGGK